MLSVLTAIVAMVAAGCGERAGKADPESKDGRTPAVADKVAGESATSAAPAAKPVEESIPLPSLVAVKMVEDKFPDGAKRVLHQVDFYSDGSTRDNGVYMEYWPSGKKFADGRYSDGKKHDEWTFYDENGKKAKTGTYKQGKANGPFIYWHPDGTKEREENYRDDKPHGVWLYFNAKGVKVRQEEYRDGLRDGTCLWWNEDGKVVRQQVYQNGQPVR